MSRNFPPIKSKVRMFDISDVRREFLKATGEGYMIRASTNLEDFYIVLD